MFFYYHYFWLVLIFLFLSLNKNKFFWASLFVGLATATRITGLALLPSLIWAGYRHYAKKGRFPLVTLFAPLGFILFGLYLQLTTGNGLTIILGQKDWYKPMGLLGPWQALKDGFLKFLYASPFTKGNFFGHSMEIIEFLSAVFFILIIWLSYKKIKFSYWLFIFFSAWPIFFSGSLSSIHRYLVVLFPVYIYLAKTLKGKYYLALCLSFFILLVYLTSLFLRGYWVA